MKIFKVTVRASQAILLTLAMIVMFLFGTYTSFFALRRTLHQPVSGNPLREQAHQYQFINPLLAVGDIDQLKIDPPFIKRISSIFEEQTSADAADAIGVYYRDLNTGRWAGFREDEKFAPASMYKIAMLLTVLKMAETNPSILESQVTFDTSVYQPGTQEGIEPEKRLEANRRYTINELLTRMIVYSDNEAASTLLHYTGAQQFEELFTHLGVAMPELENADDTMSARTFSIFFRILYNATYLSQELSEQALTLLSRTSFNDGMVAGVTSGTVVSHKFGRRTFTQAEQTEAPLELHDCGIVYVPVHPYLVCIMTKGRDDVVLQKIISDISQQIYQGHVQSYQ